MKEVLRNKKVVYTIIGIISVALVAIALTYAYWQLTRTQAGENLVTTACIDIDLVGENDITLQEQYPISDGEGKKLTPYEFTITNKCNKNVSYQIALESIGTESEAVSAEALKVSLNDSAAAKLSTFKEITPTYTGAYKANKLTDGTLAASGEEGSSKAYKLRLWIADDATVAEMNKTFRSKITVTAGQGIEDTLNLKEELLANYDFGTEFSKTFAFGSGISQNDGIIAFGTEYVIANSGYGDDFVLGGTIVEATFEECYKGLKECGPYVVSNGDFTNIRSGHYLVEYDEFIIQDEGTDYEYYTIKNTKFYESVPTGTAKAEDDYGTSYILKGGTNPEVNYKYISFADKLWRLVRVNGDGTYRIALKDKLPYNGFNVEEGVSGKLAVGYMYGTASDPYANVNDSTAKNFLDAWYQENLLNYEDKLADRIFCNDRKDTNGDGTYDVAERSKPSLKCSQDNDKFTVNTKNGNGALEHPIGMLSADEYVLLNDVNGSVYEYESLMSPYKTDGQMITANAGYFSYYNFVTPEYALDYFMNIRPVINLKANTEFSGSGTETDPYKVL